MSKSEPRGALRHRSGGAPARPRSRKVAAEAPDACAPLRTQVLRYELALDNVGIGICSFDGEYRLRLFNRRYAEIYGIAPEALRLGMTLTDILAMRAAVGAVPDMAPEAYIAWTQADVSMEGPTGVIVELRNGRVINLRHQPLPEGGYVSTHEDITEQRLAEMRAAFVAHHDALTGLPNRALLRERMDQALGEALAGRPCAVLAVDIDDFRSVRDGLGYTLSDALVRTLADRLREALAPGDTLARIGVDEFAVVQVGAGVAEATMLAERLLREAGRTVHIDGQPVQITASIGIALAPRDGHDADQLLRHADLALGAAKATGRGRLAAFAATMDSALQRRRSLEADLRDAIANEALTLVYQPIANLQTGRVTGFEALLRWDRPVVGRVSPGEFIPLAEENGLIVPIGEWVLRRACAEAASWPRWVKLAVNVSAAQFRAPGLHEAVAAALAGSGLAAARLELEITESAMMQNWEETTAILQRLKRLGVRISMDDFGTGYSSLSYLRRFPFDKIKIDQAFVRELSAASQSVVIVRAIVDLCDALGMTTTAEGVETQEQLDILTEEGCTEVQGYLLSAPRPPSEVLALVEQLDGVAPAARPLRRPAFVAEARPGRRQGSHPDPRGAG